MAGAAGYDLGTLSYSSSYESSSASSSGGGKSKPSPAVLEDPLPPTHHAPPVYEAPVVESVELSPGVKELLAKLFAVVKVDAAGETIRFEEVLLAVKTLVR